MKLHPDISFAADLEHNYVQLLLAIIRQAAKDAECGQASALKFLENIPWLPPGVNTTTLIKSTGNKSKKGKLS